jgi:hypothetical protein
LLGLLRRYEVMTIWKVDIGLRFSLSRKFYRAELEQAISNYGPILQLHPNEIYNNTSIEYFFQLVVHSEDYSLNHNTELL